MIQFFMKIIEKNDPFYSLWLVASAEGACGRLFLACARVFAQKKRSQRVVNSERKIEKKREFGKFIEKTQPKLNSHL